MPGERQSNLRRLVCTLIAAHLLLGIAMFATAAWAKPQTTDSLLSQAAELQKARDFAGAEKLYRQALVDAPDDPEILKALAVVCQAEGKYAESIEIFQSILKRAPRSEEHTSELQSHSDLVCRLLLEKKKKTRHTTLSSDDTNRSRTATATP